MRIQDMVKIKVTKKKTMPIILVGNNSVEKPN